MAAVQKLLDGIGALIEVLPGILGFGVVVCILVYPFWDAFYPRPIVGDDFTKLRITGSVVEYNSTDYSIIATAPNSTITDYFFVLHFYNRSKFIVREAKVYLVIKSPEGRIVATEIRECLRSGGIKFWPAKETEPFTYLNECGFELGPDANSYVQNNGDVPELDRSGKIAYAGGDRPAFF